MSVWRLFYEQRAGAHRRGIAWALTFEEWLAWWGDDLSRRGVGHDNLQMQRIGDQGAYALDNIRKGYPRDNGKTRGLARLTRQAQRGAKEREAVLDRAMFEPSAPPKDEIEFLGGTMEAQ